MTAAALTVHDLAADWSRMATAAGFRVPGRRTVWERAEYVPGRGDVRVSAVRAGDRGIVGVVRYMDPATRVELVP